MKVKVLKGKGLALTKKRKRARMETWNAVLSASTDAGQKQSYGILPRSVLTNGHVLEDERSAWSGSQGSRAGSPSCGPQGERSRDG